MAVTGADNPATPALEARELYRFYHVGDDETFALRGVSLVLRAGEVVAVIGPSGSGKSTLLACLAGLEDPDGGSVTVEGQRITRVAEPVRAGLRARRLGILLQSGNLLAHLSVAGNIRAAQSLGPGGPDCYELLDRVGLRDRADAWPVQLSGGEAARAGLAVALANGPAVLLADEPTGETDAVNESLLLALLRDRAETGAAVLLVTHSQRVASAADRVLRLVDGRFADE
jgi:putative ABC transport system ATP-binding protein